MLELGLDPENIATWDDFMVLLEGTKKKGLIGYAMGDKGGWEAMGTFSILNVRMNGYDYTHRPLEWPRSVDRSGDDRRLQPVRTPHPVHERKLPRYFMGWHARPPSPEEVRRNDDGLLVG